MHPIVRAGKNNPWGLQSFAFLLQKIPLLQTGTWYTVYTFPFWGKFISYLASSSSVTKVCRYVELIFFMLKPRWIHLVHVFLPLLLLVKVTFCGFPIDLCYQTTKKINCIYSTCTHLNIFGTYTSFFLFSRRHGYPIMIVYDDEWKTDKIIK
jgi:hypothetical protein